MAAMRKAWHARANGRPLSLRWLCFAYAGFGWNLAFLAEYHALIDFLLTAAWVALLVNEAFVRHRAKVQGHPWLP
jgi:hypothetical protein